MTESSTRNDATALGGDAEPAAEEGRYRELLALVERQAVPSIIAYLGDPAWRVRRAAVRALGELRGTPILVPALVAGMASTDNAGLRNACAEALERIGAGAVPELVRTLVTPDPDHRKFIVEVLGNIGTTEAAQALGAALDDQDDNVRSAAVEALGRVGGEAAIGRLRQRLAAPAIDLLQRVYLLDAFGRLKARLSFEELEPWIHNTAVSRVLAPLLGWCGDVRAAPLLIAGVERGPAKSREVAAQALASLMKSVAAGDRPRVVAALRERPRGRAALLELLATVEGGSLAAVVELVAQLGDPGLAPDLLVACARGAAADAGLAAAQRLGPAAVPFLLAAVDHADIESRVLFLEAVEMLGDVSVVATLLEIAREPETRATETAVRVIGALGDGSAVDDLMRLAREAGAEIREATVMALAAIGRRHPAVVSGRLRQAVNQGDVRAEWVRALGAIGRDEDQELLINATHHRDADVREAALDSAASFGGDFPEEVLVFALTDEQPRVRAAAARALCAYHTPTACAALLAATRDRDPWVVAEAMRGLGFCHSQDAIAALKAATASPSSPVAITALQGLLRLNPPGLSQVAGKAISHPDPEVAREAVALALRLSEEEAGGFLIQCLGHGSWIVRVAAVEALLARRLRVSPALVERHLRTEDEALVREPLTRLLALAEAGA